MTARPRPWRAALLLAWAAFGLYALLGAGTVPFHPDEATYLYMSRDFDLLFRHGRPAAVGWQAPGQPALVRRYRLLDAPAVRYLAGLGRSLAGEPALPNDWNWSATWAQNAAAGAVPTARALTAARWPAALLTGLSLGLVYAIGRAAGGPAVGLAAAALYALSGLLLLHGRRAMSEGPLVFAVLLTMWVLLQPRPRPLLAALALAAAVAAKLTALALLPAAGAAFLLYPGGWRARGQRLLVFALALLLALWALHPSLWSAPIAGLRAMLAARAAYLADQSAFLQAAAPSQLLTGPGLRGLALFYHNFFAPLAFADVGNYTAATAAAEARYASLPLHLGWHTLSLPLNLALGSLVLAAALLGAIDMLRGLRHAPQPPPALPAWRTALLLALWTLSTAAFLLLITVPYQRYYLPLLPALCVWAALGLRWLACPVVQRRTHGSPVPTSP